VELTVTGVDHAPPELNEQVPFKIKLLRLIPGLDRPDYWLGEVLPPLFWMKDDQRIEITHLVVCARWQSTKIEPHIQDLPIGIAYVTDPTQFGDETVHFDKCKYVAIGFAHETSGNDGPPSPTGGIKSGRIGNAFGLGKD
jgi:hypothetical protein